MIHQLVKGPATVKVKPIGDAILVRVRSKIGNGTLLVPETAKRNMSAEDSYVEIVATPELDPDGKMWPFQAGDQVLIQETPMIAVQELGDDHFMITRRSIIGVVYPLAPSDENVS